MIWTAARRQSHWPGRTTRLLPLLLLGILFVGGSRARSQDGGALDAPQYAQHGAQHPLAEHGDAGGPPLLRGPEITAPSVNRPATVFYAVVSALHVMQSRFFAIWHGTWPYAIDWTAAVMGTQVSTSLAAFSLSGIHRGEADVALADQHVLVSENLINRYTQQLSAFYFGENAFGLRNQAYDDMLWVVLGWLESIKFIDLHSDLHYASSAGANGSTWYAKQFSPAFAHRARIFYDLAARGWNTTLCGGGMIWSPWLTPYKNAITNELFIAASVNMYLYFPGDLNSSPFLANGPFAIEDEDLPAKANDPKYLEAAITGYRWLSSSNMKNSQGLYVDGFHIHGWKGGANGSVGTGNCDVRNEAVYTYNQGVILTGLRGLWEATGATRYLEDGHQLIGDVIAATGWYDRGSETRYKWAGLGRNGVMEEACDPSGSCSQDSQCFKGIFFLHLTTFCASLPVGLRDGVGFKADADVASLHRQSCRGYASWIAHNARAAYGTGQDGVFGMWWTIGLTEEENPNGLALDVPHEGIDYRNQGVPNNTLWRFDEDQLSVDEQQQPRASSEGRIGLASVTDPNDRGRGRTVETHSGGVSVLRALYRLNVMDGGYGLDW
jgi:hypothetical protein